MVTLTVRKVLVALIAFGMAWSSPLAFAATETEQGSPAAASPRIVLGAILPLSGELAAMGAAVRNGIEKIRP